MKTIFTAFIIFLSVSATAQKLPAPTNLDNTTLLVGIDRITPAVKGGLLLSRIERQTGQIALVAGKSISYTYNICYKDGRVMKSVRVVNQRAGDYVLVTLPAGASISFARDLDLANN